MSSLGITRFVDYYPTNPLRTSEEPQDFSALKTVEKISLSIMPLSVSESAEDKGIQAVDITKELAAQKKREAIESWSTFGGVGVLLLALAATILTLLILFPPAGVIIGAVLSGLAAGTVLGLVVATFISIALGLNGLDQRRHLLDEKIVQADMSIEQLKGVFEVADKKTRHNLTEKANLQQLATISRASNWAVDFLTSDYSYEKKKAMIDKAPIKEKHEVMNVLRNPQLLSLCRRKMSLSKKMSSAIHYHHLRVKYCFEARSFVQMSGLFFETLLDAIKDDPPQNVGTDESIANFSAAVNSLSLKDPSLTQRVQSVVEILKCPNRELNDSEARDFAINAFEFADGFMDSIQLIFTDEEIKNFAKQNSQFLEYLKTRQSLKT